MSRIGLFVGVGVGAEDQDSRRVKLSCLEHEAIEEGSNRVYVGGLRLIKPGGIMSPTCTPSTVPAQSTAPKIDSSTVFPKETAANTLSGGCSHDVGEKQSCSDDFLPSNCT